MTKTILSVAVVAMVFSGCVGTARMVQDANMVENTAVENAKATEDTAIQGVTNTINSVTDTANTVTDANVTTPTTGSLKDMAVDKAVEVADEHTDGKASVVKELIK